MNDSISLKIYVALAGLIALAIGGMILLAPTQFYATNGIVLGSDASLLNEIRASGGLLVGAAGLILAGLVYAELRFVAVLLATVLYLAYGLARLIGFAMDGLPADGLVTATVIELVLGGVGVAVMIRGYWINSSDY